MNNLAPVLLSGIPKNFSESEVREDNICILLVFERNIYVFCLLCMLLLIVGLSVGRCRGHLFLTGIV